jgi:hypothetical protein
MGYMLDPAGMGEGISELRQDLREAALATLPGWAQISGEGVSGLR